MFRFTGNVRKFRNGRLHAESQFLLGNRGLNLGISDFGEVLPVQLAHGVEHPAPDILVDAAGIRQEEDWIA